MRAGLLVPLAGDFRCRRPDHGWADAAAMKQRGRRAQGAAVERREGARAYVTGAWEHPRKVFRCSLVSLFASPTKSAGREAGEHHGCGVPHQRPRGAPLPRPARGEPQAGRAQAKPAGGDEREARHGAGRFRDDVAGRGQRRHRHRRRPPGTAERRLFDIVNRKVAPGAGRGRHGCGRGLSASAATGRPKFWQNEPTRWSKADDGPSSGVSRPLTCTPRRSPGTRRP